MENKGSSRSWALAAAVTGFVGTSVLTTTLVHPLDVVKVRMQLATAPAPKMAALGTSIARVEGWKALYMGLSAGILRQATYTAARLGVFFKLYENHKRIFGYPSLLQKVQMGMYASLAGAFLACPFEVVLVQMVADGPIVPYRRYSGLFDAMFKISFDGGYKELWRGMSLTLSRAMLISVSQIVTYAQTHEYLLDRDMPRGLETHLLASVIASFVACAVSLPVDVIKTNYQVARSDMFIRKTVNYLYREQGIRGFYKGFVPYFSRMSLHTIITFYIMGSLITMYSRTQKHINNIKEK